MRTSDEKIPCPAPADASGGEQSPGYPTMREFRSRHRRMAVGVAIAVASVALPFVNGCRSRGKPAIDPAFHNNADGSSSECAEDRAE